MKSAFTVDGHLYAVPANLATFVLYYNKDDVHRGRHHARRRPPQDEFIADVKKLTWAARTDAVRHLPGRPPTIQMWPILQWMNGGDIIDAKGCATVERRDERAGPADLGRAGRAGQESARSARRAPTPTRCSRRRRPRWRSTAPGPPRLQAAGINLGIVQVPVGSAGPVTLASTVPLMIGKNTKHKDRGQAVPGLVDLQDRAGHVLQGVRVPAGAHRHGHGRRPDRQGLRRGAAPRAAVPGRTAELGADRLRRLRSDDRQDHPRRRTSPKSAKAAESRRSTASRGAAE